MGWIVFGVAVVVVFLALIEYTDRRSHRRVLRMLDERILESAKTGRVQ